MELVFSKLGFFPALLFSFQYLSIVYFIYPLLFMWSRLQVRFGILWPFLSSALVSFPPQCSTSCFKAQMYVRGFLLNKIVMILLLNFPCFLEIKIRRKQFQNIIVWSVYMVCCLRNFRKLLSYGENWRDEVAKVSIVKLYTKIGCIYHFRWNKYIPYWNVVIDAIHNFE